MQHKYSKGDDIMSKKKRDEPNPEIYLKNRIKYCETRLEFLKQELYRCETELECLVQLEKILLS